jgi:hypothetical protein
MGGLELEANSSTLQNILREPTEAEATERTKGSGCYKGRQPPVHQLHYLRKRPFNWCFRISGRRGANEESGFYKQRRPPASVDLTTPSIEMETEPLTLSEHIDRGYESGSHG